ncbi:hypothetical protein FKW77_010111 [Venturia effusa]|uniref:Inner kinetochore subunit AME1 domain-containing protein n=1 Tax=Venturia effusa TaxID=50376 RepID=A0A517L0D7_9PEZI|nr:hypothetical protein FKW77_010111 [Venturia effusa]
MAERQERRLMRQRGAGPRELKNAGFSFNFGAAPPLPARQSSRKTPRPSPAQASRKSPQSPLAQQPSTRKTPAGSGTNPAPDARIRENSASLAPSSGSGNNNGDRRTFKTPVTTGKRKRGRAQLDAVAETEQDELETTPEDIAASKSSSIRPSIEVPASAQKTPAARARDANEIEEPDELSPENDGSAIKNYLRQLETPTLLRRLSERRTRPSEGSIAGSPILSIEEDEVDEEDELSFGDSQTATNVAQSPHEKRGSSSGLAMATSATGGLNVSLTAPNDQSTRQEIFETPAGEPIVDPLPAIGDLEQNDEDELSPERGTQSSSLRRTGRKNRVVVEDDEEDELSPPKVTKSKQSGKTTRSSVVVSEENAEDNISEDELSPVRPTTRRQPEKAPIGSRNKPSKRRRVEEPPVQVHEDDAEGEASEIDELSPQQTRPVPKPKPQTPRHPLSKATANLPRKSKQPKKATDRAASPPRKKTKGDVIGITVYRRTESSNIAYKGLGSHPNPGITPVDVLAQVSSELADNHILAFQQQARTDNVSRKTKDRQVRAMRDFKSVLKNSLLAIRTKYLDAYVLGRQLRAANKRKRQLREELMGRRRERELLEVEMDRVRAKHEEMVEKGDREFELVQSLRDIEGAVRKGREKAREEGREDEGPHVGIEMAVGSAKDSLGLLGKVKEWNGVLESSAQLLEGRA